MTRYGSGPVVHPQPTFDLTSSDCSIPYVVLKINLYPLTTPHHGCHGHEVGLNRSEYVVLGEL